MIRTLNRLTPYMPYILCYETFDCTWIYIFMHINGVGMMFAIATRFSMPASHGTSGYLAATSGYFPAIARKSNTTSTDDFGNTSPKYPILVLLAAFHVCCGDASA